MIIQKVLWDRGELHQFYCPACNTIHSVTVGSKEGWHFNGDYNKPSYQPSILVARKYEGLRCHSYVKDGFIQYLSDCSHPLAGQTLPLPHIPDHFIRKEADD